MRKFKLKIFSHLVHRLPTQNLYVILLPSSALVHSGHTYYQEFYKYDKTGINYTDVLFAEETKTNNKLKRHIGCLIRY